MLEKKTEQRKYKLTLLVEFFRTPFVQFIEWIVLLQESLLDLDINFMGQQKAGKSSLMTEITGEDCNPGNLLPKSRTLEKASHSSPFSSPSPSPSPSFSNDLDTIENTKTANLIKRYYFKQSTPIQRTLTIVRKFVLFFCCDFFRFFL